MKANLQKQRYLSIELSMTYYSIIENERINIRMNLMYEYFIYVLRYKTVGR